MPYQYPTDRLLPHLATSLSTVRQYDMVGDGQTIPLLICYLACCVRWKVWMPASLEQRQSDLQSSLCTAILVRVPARVSLWLSFCSTREDESQRYEIKQQTKYMNAQTHREREECERNESDSLSQEQYSNSEWNGFYCPMLYSHKALFFIAY